MKTSVLIASINDPQLERTIKSLRENADNKVEFVVINDGGKSLSIPGVKVINHSKVFGRRRSFNRAARLATGDYLFIVDPHCSMTPNWDTKMAESCGDKNLVYSVLWDIDPHTWERKGGAYLHVSMNKQYTEKWWPKKRKIEECETEEESMCFTGCGWMIKKERYWELGGYDESLGKYGWDGPEWSCKVWLSDNPGKVILRTDVICGHIFGTNLKGKLYQTQMIPQAQYLKYMKEKWGNKINKLVEYFAPVPDWHKQEGSIMSQGTEKTITLRRQNEFKEVNEKGEVIGRKVEYLEYVYHGNLSEEQVFQKHKDDLKIVRTEEWKLKNGKMHKIA